MSKDTTGAEPGVRHLQRAGTVDSVTGDAFVMASEGPSINGRKEGQSKPAESKPTGSRPPDGSILTGKQEHYLKREMISQQTEYEISELSSPTALQRFGAPFRSDAGEVPPEDSELPLLRYIFVHHVRNFPFLDQAREKEFWQDKLQIFLESFAIKHISSSDDRLEETKRRKLAIKAHKLVELMMVSGIPTASGYEERIRFDEMEVVDRSANDAGLVANVPEGQEIQGWDVNIAGVRTTSVKRNIRYHQHAEFLIRVKERGKDERYVGRRFGQFSRLHKQLRTEFPGKVLPPLPRKNKQHTAASLASGDADDSDDSVSSVSTQDTGSTDAGESKGFRSYLGLGSSHKRNPSASSGRSTPRRSSDGGGAEHVTLYREEQRVSLRASLRNMLQNERLAQSKAMRDFLTSSPIRPNREELEDMKRRKAMDERRIEEQKQFYEIARKRAAELDVHMEKFRRDIVESNGLTKLFKEIRVKERISDLAPEYQKFAEWLRIEVAATIYHLFLSEDNSPELFAQARRIHSLVPYVALKNVIRYANPAAVMKGVLDLFLAQPLGARSLMQRIFGLAINDGIRTTQKSIDTLDTKIAEPTFTSKVQTYVNSPEDVKNDLRAEAEAEGVDLLVILIRSESLQPPVSSDQTGKIFNAYVAYTAAVDAPLTDTDLKSSAELFSHLKQYLKLVTRQRDKSAMLALIEEPVTLQLFRDLFTIFYEPLVRVYKSANVYTSVTDFASFADDCIRVIEACQRQDVSADPNQTVQAFIDLCARHEDDLYKFVHEVHIHDNGLFDQLMGWLEGILEFLRHGPKGGKLDMNALFQGAVASGQIDAQKATAEIDALIAWQTARKEWHNAKTRRKMAAEGSSSDVPDGAAGPNGSSTSRGGGLRTSDFGLNPLDISDLGLSAEDADEDAEEAEREAAEDEEGADLIGVERERRKRMREALASRKGEPEKPDVKEVEGLREGFVSLLRGVLAEG